MVVKAGTIEVQDNNGISDEMFDDWDDGYTDPDDGNYENRVTEDQIVLFSDVDGINIGDFIDSRYSHLITNTSNRNNSIETYFLATNGQDNFGQYFVANSVLDPNAFYYFEGYTNDGRVRYDDIEVSNTVPID
jgi:hypothetical protein